MIPNKVAEILIEIGLKGKLKDAVARPWEPCALLMVAIVVSEDAQVTDVVRSCVLLSEKCPVAKYCRVEPIKIEGGETECISIDSSTIGVTVSVVDPEMLPDVAEIVVEPAATVVASPLEPVRLLMVAILVFEEFHVTDEVISCVEVSEKVPMATNCLVVPRTMLGFTGVTEIDDRSAGVTVSVAGELNVMVEKDAKIVAVPALTAVANPRELAALLIVAIPVVDEDHVATVVRICCAPSAK